VIAGWAAGLVLCLADSMMWCELGAALPGSGGTFHYLREAFRGTPLARILPFLFIWQFIFSAPLEVASGCIGFSSYLNVLWPAAWGPLAILPPGGGDPVLTTLGRLIACSVAGVAVVLLYRKIDSIGKLTVALWAGMIVTVAAVICTVSRRFDPALAFSLPPGGVRVDGQLALAFGAALSIAMYDFLGYYDICYLGDEVRDPAKTIPRAVIISVLAVAALYAVMNLGILGVLPVERVAKSTAIVADLSNEVWGSPAVTAAFTVLILWTAFASVFALLLGYSRIPYAAARDGYFFAVFKDLHPTKDFPRVALLVMGAVTIAACWFPFGDVLTALLTSRILAQFVAQVGAVIALRRNRPDVALPFRMWLYPAPCAVALAGWLFVFGTSGGYPILFGLGTLAAGLLAYGLIFRGRKGPESAAG
jgi:amino acid transporter